MATTTTQQVQQQQKHQQQQQPSAKERASNFMSQFRDAKTKELKNLTSNQFMEVWSHYDNDGNGFIEGKELDSFLREFISSVKDTDVRPELVTDTMLAEIKECFMEAYDDNKDGKIEIRELAQLLPLEESFLLLFRFDNPLDSSVEFMKIWNKYDTDGSGCIDSEELKNFLRDLVSTELTDTKLNEYCTTLLDIYDANKDGKLQLSEMAKLLPVKENFLAKMGTSLSVNKTDIDRVFSSYDKDNNGFIENEELNGFLKDLLGSIKKDYEATDLTAFRDSVLAGCDTNRDGKINKKELTSILLGLAKLSEATK